VFGAGTHAVKQQHQLLWCGRLLNDDIVAHACSPDCPLAH
jgi:hypothetical protein